MAIKRAPWTVYCETCQRSFFTYVLGRGVEKWGQAKARARAAEHLREQPDHVVKVSVKEQA